MLYKGTHGGISLNMDWVHDENSSLRKISPWYVSLSTVLIICFSSNEDFSFANIWKVQTLLKASKRLLFTIVYIAGIVVIVLFPTKFTFPYQFWLMLKQAAKTFMQPLVIQ